MKKINSILSLLIALSILLSYGTIIAGATDDQIGNDNSFETANAEEAAIAEASAILGFEADVSKPLVFDQTVPTITNVDMERFQKFIEDSQKADDTISSEEQFTISQIKPITDFSGNLFYDIECNPTGYFIYSPDVDEFMEFSSYAESPYIGLDEHLYWCGPLNSYVYSDGEYYNTITDEKIESSNELAYMVSYSFNLNESIKMAQEKEDTEVEVQSTEATLTETLVSSGNFFANLSTKEEMGYWYNNVGNGYCGYIAAGLLLLYYDCCASDGFINDAAYLTSVGNAFDGSKFTKDLYEKHGKGISGTAAYPIGGLRGINEVIESYCNSKGGLSVKNDTTTLGTFGDLNAKLATTKRPIIVFGSIWNSSTSSKSDHAVVAYGYRSDGYTIVHYGHPGRSKIYLYPYSMQNIIGTTYRIASYSSSDSASKYVDLGFSWGRKPICRCINHGIMNGVTTNTWEPNTALNRAMLVTTLYRLAGSPQVTVSNPFSDVSSSRYYYKAVLWAYQNGITKGTTATQFSPNQTVSRTQAVVMLYRFARKYGYNITRSDGQLSKYSDLNSMSGETRSAWEWGLETGIINGYKNGSYWTLRPKEPLVRIQLAKLLNSMQCLSGKWKG